MSVPNQTPYNIYTANGLTTVFTYEFYIISASDLRVSINGDVVTSGYTVAGVGNKDGGDINFLTPPANGAVVMLERVVPTYRLTDYQDNGDLLADTVNKDFDRIWMAIQRAFIDLGFALTRPFFGGPFNAKGYRIEKLADPVNDQDAATKKYVIENGKTNLARTLRVPESTVAPLPSIGERKSSLLGWNSQGNPIPIFAMTDTADLAVKLASSTGAKLVGYRGITAYKALSKIRTLDDSENEIGYLGYNPIADAAVWNERQDDNNCLIPGGLYIGKDTYGLRRNACGLSVRINHGTGAFNPQITGVYDSIGLRAYASVDDAAIFFEGHTEAWRVGEDVSSVSSYASDSVIGDFDFSLVKKGMILATKHSPSWWGTVASIDQVNKTIYVDKWSNDGVTASTPTGATGLYINYKTKTFGLNGNVVIDADSKASHATGFELGMVNNKLILPTDFNGFDSVSLGSRQGTAAYYGRNSKAGNNWQNGVRIVGASVACFYAGVGTEGTIPPRGFVNAGSQEGFLSYSSVTLYHSVVRDGSITGTVKHSIGGNGLAIEFHYSNSTISPGETMTDGNFLWIYATTASGTVSLNAGPYHGKTKRIRKVFTAGTLTISGNGSNILTPASTTAVSTVALTTAGTYEFTFNSSLNAWVMG
ncbi:phage tail fiber domain-containing protein [Klebsiella pasteurii]|uniref:phage tail fiber domain-containing protein n=1 Tax=Klebsiella pasteurii TaxID=2587529 RepID=UPI00391D4FDF